MSCVWSPALTVNFRPDHSTLAYRSGVGTNFPDRRPPSSPFGASFSPSFAWASFSRLGGTIGIDAFGTLTRVSTVNRTSPAGKVTEYRLSLSSATVIAFLPGSAGWNVTIAPGSGCPLYVTLPDTFPVPGEQPARTASNRASPRPDRARASRGRNRALGIGSSPVVVSAGAE